MIEILEKKIYFSGYGTSKYRCKWKYTNELGISAGMSKNAEMSQNRLCERSAAISILAPASAPEIASGVNITDNAQPSHLPLAKTKKAMTGKKK